MDISFAERLGTEDRVVLSISIINGELEFTQDKPDEMGWQELIYFIKYIIAQALSEQQTELSIGDIFQWLGAQGSISDEVEKSAEDILVKARNERMRELMQNESLRLDNVDR